MCREAELFVFLLLNDLNKCIKEYVDNDNDNDEYFSMAKYEMRKDIILTALNNS